MTTPLPSWAENRATTLALLDLGVDEEVSIQLSSWLQSLSTNDRGNAVSCSTSPSKSPAMLSFMPDGAITGRYR
jgi:hypothetical protein